MGVFLYKDNMYVLAINNRVAYVFDKKKATNFANTTVENFIKTKKRLEEREGTQFELEFVHF